MSFSDVPWSAGTALPGAAQLASWDGSGTTGQTKLASYLTDVEAAALPQMQGDVGPLALALTIGLPAEVDLADPSRWDLDN